jgi:Protein of unknown function (DUF3309)
MRLSTFRSNRVSARILACVLMNRDSSALGRHPNGAGLNLYEEFVKAQAARNLQAPACAACDQPLTKTLFSRGFEAVQSRREGERMLIILIILLLVFGFGGYRLGPGLGYYGGGGVSLIILIVIILLLLKVI